MTFRLLLLFLLLCGAEAKAASAIFLADETQQQFEQRLANSPVVTRLKPGLAVQCAPDEVELHYKKFHLLNSPDLIVDWQYHYVVAPASKPRWRGSAVADIAAYFPAMDDATALALLREQAFALGGCGVTTVFREPVTLEGSRQPDGSFTRSRIIGYAYFGKIVRRR